MNTTHTFKATLIVAALLAWPLAQSAPMAKGDYDAGKSRISATYKSAKTACDAQSGNGKDVCVEEAKAREKVARAELEYGYSGKPADQTKVLVAQAEANYAVAKEKCDDMAGNAKDVCVKEAKAVEVKALADAKLGKQIGEARTDANTDKRDADYKVASEKCESLAGEAKSACVAAAKARFGKT